MINFNAFFRYALLFLFISSIVFPGHEERLADVKKSVEDNIKLNDELNGYQLGANLVAYGFAYMLLGALFIGAYIGSIFPPEAEMLKYFFVLWIAFGSSIIVLPYMLLIKLKEWAYAIKPTNA